MQIIIPMTGVGQRFIDAGYKDPKPLIKVDGDSIIKYVVEMFPGEENFIFICNSKHLAESNMRETLTQIAPKGKIIEIPPHKLGPVYAVLQVEDFINDDEEVIVNYCDFGKYWNYKDFLKHNRDRNADGAVSAYKGFHPHMLGTTNYAFIRDDKQWMQEIQEKKPFTDERMNEYASDGTYYFKNGVILKKYFKKLIDLKQDINGEYYVSMVYNLLLKDDLKVSIYEIQHMLQWGTPADLEEYVQWSNYFRDVIKPSNIPITLYNSVNLIPLAGRGSRFAQEGYKDPKPLVEVSGKPMIIQASQCLPPATNHVFVCLGEHLDNYPLDEEIKKIYPEAQITRIDQVTEGQACTCKIGLEHIEKESSLMIGACDNGMLWNIDKYNELIKDENVHAIIWSFKDHPSSERNPQMYGWIKTNDIDFVEYVSVKKQISDNPRNDHAIVGAFFFKKSAYFLEAYEQLIKKDVRVNNEFYVDSLINEVINLGFNVKVFEVDHYVCWGTPNDLKTYEYWQSFFHKCNWHPYDLEKDILMNDSCIQILKEKYLSHKQVYR